MVLIATGQDVYMMNWPYPKETYDNNQTLFEASKAAQEEGKSNWHYYSSDAEEYAEHLRMKLSFDSDITFVQFHSKGNQFGETQAITF